MCTLIIALCVYYWLQNKYVFIHSFIHLGALRKQQFARVSLLRQRAETGCGASAKTPCKATFSLVYSTAEYTAHQSGVIALTLFSLTVF